MYKRRARSIYAFQDTFMNMKDGKDVKDEKNEVINEQILSSNAFCRKAVLRIAIFLNDGIFPFALHVNVKFYKQSAVKFYVILFVYSDDPIVLCGWNKHFIYFIAACLFDCLHICCFSRMIYDTHKLTR